MSAALWLTPQAARAEARHRLAAVPRDPAAGTAEGRRCHPPGASPRVKSVAWKTAIPGLGLSSPSSGGTSAASARRSAARRTPASRSACTATSSRSRTTPSTSGASTVSTRRPARSAGSRRSSKACPKIKRHTKASHANSTLATDGERLIAFFGSEGLYAYDLKGKLLWKKDLGVLDAGWFRSRRRSGKPAARRSSTTTSS